MEKNKIKRLNIGCGLDYREGWVNLDIINVKKDIKWNINKYPYPFKGNTFVEVLMQSVLEHSDEPLKMLKEVIRISENGAKIIILVPHANSYSAVTDIEHKTFFTENSFNQDLLREYELTQLKVKSIEFKYNVNHWKKYIPFKQFFKIFLNGIYDDIQFTMEVKK